MATNTIPTGLKTILDAMHAGDLEVVSDHLADDVTLKSPIVVDAFVGHDQVLGVLSALLGVMDEFNIVEILTSETHFAVLLDMRAGSTHVNGMDYVHLDEAGKVDSMMIMWRPLPAVVAVQNLLAPVIGFEPLALTPLAAAGNA